MSMNPLNELKRRLDDDETPLPKRLCLARNIVASHHFPAAPKERIIAEWLESLTKSNKLSAAELLKVLEWLDVDDIMGELKGRIVQVVAQYIQKNILQSNETQSIISFLENPKISTQLCQQIDDYLKITITLLQHLKDDQKDCHIQSERLLNNIAKYYKESKKKLEFITKFLQGKNLETIFNYLDTKCRNTVVTICQSILFPIHKKTSFISYLQTLIRKDNIEALIAEKADNIQSVLKIMSVFFDFPNGRTEMDEKFLKSFIDVFVSCFSKESQIIFAFVIMVTNVLEMKQDYIVPSMEIKPIIFEENDGKIKRNLFLDILQIILKNEVDITVRLTDTLGEKISKVEMKKNFMSFLQIVMMGQLKLNGKLDNATLQIIITALKLDPILIEQKMEEILPPVMASKKSSSILDSYTDMLNCLLEILFKLSRGTQFLSQMLPSVKLILDGNTEIKDGEKIKSKAIAGSDILPTACVEMFGKLTADLMFRQNKDMLETMQKDFEVHCLLLLEEGFVSPSTITIAEVLSAITCSFLRHNKMADHTVPKNVADEFWSAFTRFEDEFLKKFGQYLLKNYHPSLLHSFLAVCLAHSQLKLLNRKYSHCQLGTVFKSDDDVFDFTPLLPCLDTDEWITLAKMAVEEDTVSVLNNLMLVKIMAIRTELSPITTGPDTSTALSDAKTHLRLQLNSNPTILENDKYIPRVAFQNLDNSQYKSTAKSLIKIYLESVETSEMFEEVAISNNRPLLNALVLQVSKNLTQSMQNCDSLATELNKAKFKMADFAKGVDIQEYFNGIQMGDEEKVKRLIDIFKFLRLPYLEQNYQLAAIFVLLAVKKCCQSKKLRKAVDFILQSIFELSLHAPDLYQIFRVEFIFSFDDTTLLDLLTLKIKTTNPLLVVKCMVEIAVKRVKSDSDLVKNLVELILARKNKTTIESFNDPAFQITCIILPLIVKQKKAITMSAFRSILANLQEKLHDDLLQTFKSIDFSDGSFINAGNTEDVVESEGNMAALNAIAAYTLTLSRICETAQADTVNLDCHGAGLEFFLQNAMQAISNPESKPQHVESSIHLINVTLRYRKNIETHPIFNEKDNLLTKIWKSINSRLRVVVEKDENCSFMDDLGVALKFVCELVSVDGFAGLISDLGGLVVMKKPTQIIKDINKSDLTNHVISKHLWTQCLKANTIGPKLGIMTKQMFQNCRNLKFWIRQHYDTVHVASNKRKLDIYREETETKIVRVHDDVCDILRVDLEILEDVIFAGKKISLDYKFLDTIFELLHFVHYILGSNTIHLRCEVSWRSFFKLYEGSVAILNSLLVSREELLEDRWPNYMQCFKALTSTLCERAASQVLLEKYVEEKLAEIAHSIEKLTHAITKRKKQVSRIAAYTVADICTSLEKNAPSKMVRQHLENSVAVLMQSSDSTYAMAFLKRALAGSVGQMTLTNLYTVYKRYHKYTGNA